MAKNELQQMGTTGLAEYVQAGKNGRARNCRRQHAERVLSERYPASKYSAVERFRNLLCLPVPPPYAWQVRS